MSNHGSEKRRAREDPEGSNSWGDKRYDKNYPRQRREASSTQRSESWHWVQLSSRDETGSSASASEAPARSSGAWTLWKDVHKVKYRIEEGTGRKEEKKTWSSQEYRQATCERSEQDCPARKWERYPEDSQEPRYTQDEKRYSPPWQNRPGYHSWKSSAWSTHDSGAKSDYGSRWQGGDGQSDRGSWPAAKRMPTAGKPPGADVIEDALAGMDVPAVIKVGDWATGLMATGTPVRRGRVAAVAGKTTDELSSPVHGGK